MHLSFLLQHYLLNNETPTLLIIDIDDTTLINKKYGAKIGDAIIKVLEHILHTYTEVLHSGRCGDDTFYSIILSQTYNNIEPADEILRQVRTYNWSLIAQDLHVTCSIGAAVWSTDEPPDDWVTRAAIGTVNAKRRGKNCYLLGPLYLSSTQIRGLRSYLS